MNKTNQKANNTYVNYWSKSGISSKEVNNSLKIRVLHQYVDRDGKERSRETYHHPSLKDLKFETSVAKSTLGSKKAKSERFESLPYSDEHKRLIASVYSRENNILKQQAAIAAHNKKIEDLIFKRKLRKQEFMMNKKNHTNLLIIKRLDSKGLPYDFSINPSNNSLDELWKKAKEMNENFSGNMDKYFGIEVWEKEEYSKKLEKKLSNYRYCVYAVKENTKNAA